MIWEQKKIVIYIYFTNRYFDLDYKNYVLVRKWRRLNNILVYYFGTEICGNIDFSAQKNYNSITFKRKQKKGAEHFVLHPLHLMRLQFFKLHEEFVVEHFNICAFHP